MRHAVGAPNTWAPAPSRVTERYCTSYDCGTPVVGFVTDHVTGMVVVVPAEEATSGLVIIGTGTWVDTSIVPVTVLDPSTDARVPDPSLPSRSGTRCSARYRPAPRRRPFCRPTPACGSRHWRWFP